MPWQILSIEGRIFRTNPALKARSSGYWLSKQWDASPRLRAAEVWFEFQGIEKASRRIFVDAQVARLLFDLTCPNPIPSHLASRLGKSNNAVLARLVCDGLVEIKRTDGCFVHGADAAPEIFGDRLSKMDDGGVSRLDALSYAAIYYGLQLKLLGVERLARRMYQYNTVPTTSGWDRMFRAPSDVEFWLLQRKSSDRKAALFRRYNRLSSSSRAVHWMAWCHKGRKALDGARHKIYVSPEPRMLPDVMHTVTSIACAMDIPFLKVGCTVPDILRPDKLVLYLDSQDAVEQVAAELIPATKGINPQGVPFSSPLDNEGLISCAVDPSSAHDTHLLGRYSWRELVSKSLARALVNTPRHIEPSDAIDFALKRLQLEGVNCETWFTSC